VNYRRSRRGGYGGCGGGRQETTIGCPDQGRARLTGTLACRRSSEARASRCALELAGGEFRRPTRPLGPHHDLKDGHWNLRVRPSKKCLRRVAQGVGDTPQPWIKRRGRGCEASCTGSCAPRAPHALARHILDCPPIPRPPRCRSVDVSRFVAASDNQSASSIGRLALPFDRALDAREQPAARLRLVLDAVDQIADRGGATSSSGRRSALTPSTASVPPAMSISKPPSR
jgi:hypothetical protein